MASISAEALELGEIKSALPENIDIQDVKCFFFFLTAVGLWTSGL